MRSRPAAREARPGGNNRPVKVSGSKPKSRGGYVSELMNSAFAR